MRDEHGSWEWNEINDGWQPQLRAFLGAGSGLENEDFGFAHGRSTGYFDIIYLF